MKNAKNFPEYKAHRVTAQIFDKRVPEWVKENKELEKKAWAGEDEPFFELLRRNPEYLKTDLAMARIMKWRFTIQINQLFDRAKPTLHTSKEEIEKIQNEIIRARENLLRIGKILAFVESKDLRGKKKLPLLSDIYFTYIAFVSLFRGIKKAHKTEEETVKANLERTLLHYIRKLKESVSSRKPVYDLLDAFGNTSGLSEETLLSILGSKPSDYAIELTAKLYEISETTVEQVLKRLRKDHGLWLFEKALTEESLWKKAPASWEEAPEIMFAALYMVTLILSETLKSRNIDINDLRK